MARKKISIGFRVDAGNITGTGHLMEIVSLIKSLREKIDFCGVAVANDYPLCREKLAPLVDRLELIPEAVIGDGEFDFMAPIIEEEAVEFMVTDMLKKPASYYEKFAELVKDTYVILDSEVHEEIPATVVVNFNILQSQVYYDELTSSGDGGSEYFIGPKYAVLDESLRKDWSDKVSFNEEVKKIFVNQGGSDPYALTAKTLRALEKVNLAQEIIVVVGGALKKEDREELNELRPKLKGSYSFYENVPLSEMYRLLNESDLALTAAGNTLYEMAFFGLPSIIICHHEDHNRVAESFAKRKAAVNLGIGTDVSEDEIAEATVSMINDIEGRRSLSETARGIVDGLGTSRLAGRMVEDINQAKKRVM